MILNQDHEMRLDAKLDKDSPYRMYKSSELVESGESRINGVYLRSEDLPDPPPERIIITIKLPA